MNKRVIYFVLSLFILSSIVAAGVILTKDYETSSEIKGRINGVEKTLQEAIDEGLLINDELSPRNISSNLTAPDGGHNIDEILVSINGQEMTLQQALETQNLCGLTGSSINSYNTTLDPGHYATEIEVNISGQIKSLQEAIDAGDVLYTRNNGSICYNNDSYWQDSCGRRQDLKEACGSGEFQGDYYCTEADEDIYRNQESVCSLGECGADTTSVKVYECEGSCSGGDCYGPWSESKLYCAGYGSSPEDTCPGSDESNPYTCGSTINTSCKDIHITKILDPGQTQGACGLNSPFAYVYGERTINCYAP